MDLGALRPGSQHCLVVEYVLQAIEHFRKVLGEDAMIRIRRAEIHLELVALLGGLNRSLPTAQESLLLLLLITKEQPQALSDLIEEGGIDALLSHMPIIGQDQFLMEVRICN